MPTTLRPFSTGDFPELHALQTLAQRANGLLRTETLCEVTARGARLPVHCLELGATSTSVPAVGFFGGVHGVERIGSQVIIAFLASLIERLHWDDTLAHMLDQVRLVFVPVVNPGGMLNRTRSNPAGVDLMRNAPVEADAGVPWLLGGQRWSSVLPWYRGPAGAPMQPEAQAVVRAVEEKVLPHAFGITLDCHSGFGARDRIWFPYARTRKPIECLAEIYALRTMFRTTHPYHGIYTIEPQAHQYTTHGDLWDCLYERSRAQSERLFIPLTLEIGSWAWVKKNPGQLFSLLGLFNPVAPHRHDRTLRRHLTFLDFLIRAAISHTRWRPPEASRQSLFDSAVAYWYRPKSATM